MSLFIYLLIAQNLNCSAIFFAITADAHSHTNIHVWINCIIVFYIYSLCSCFVAVLFLMVSWVLSVSSHWSIFSNDNVRLAAVQMTLQSFIDTLFDALFTADNSLSPAVKYLFDLFDSAASQHALADPDVVHSWKSNRSVQPSTASRFSFCIRHRCKKRSRKNKNV